MSHEQQFQSMQQFRFQEQFLTVRSMVDQAGDPWFVAKDVADILDFRDATVATQTLEEDEKGTCKVCTLNGEQTMIIINESGLYNLIFRSNKPQAKVFRKWVTGEVLPAIRKQGHYGFVQKAPIPTDRDQALAMCAYLVRHERGLNAQLKTIRQMKSACMAQLLSSAPTYLIPEIDSSDLFANT